MLTGDQLTDAMESKLRGSFGLIPVQVIADFCRVDLDTAAKWFGQGRPLGGQPTLRLMYLLEAAGLDVPEVGDIQDAYPLGEYIGRLLAFGVVTMDEAKAIAGTEKAATILRATRAEGVLPNCKRTPADLRQEYGERLAGAIRVLREKLPNACAVNGDTGVEEAPGAQTPVLGRLSLGDPVDDYLAGAAAQFAALYPEVVRLLELPSEQRARFRELVNPEVLFQLTTGLGRLGSARAHREGDR